MIDSLDERTRELIAAYVALWNPEIMYAPSPSNWWHEQSMTRLHERINLADVEPTIAALLGTRDS